MWALTDAEHSGDPNEAIIFRLAGGCLDSERLVSAPDAQVDYRASDVAVDGDTLYLVAPGTGIVTHSFAPSGPCVDQ
jgi:hypothetical protein